MAIEITNITRSPLQLILRSKRSKDFATKNVPGIGKGNNKYVIEDEQYTEYVDRVVKAGHATKKTINIKKKY